jgi:probable F420-dependent oxidoreductase
MFTSVRMPTDAVQLPQEFGTAEAVMDIALQVEACGFSAVNVTEHPLPEDEWMRTGGHHALDPFVALSFAAAATTQLRLVTNLCVVPYRDAFVTAKAVASLDALSEGRFILGAGAGYLEAEFQALHADFERRNETFDEAIVEMKRVWTGESIHVEASGKQHHALPRPVQRPHPPIWVGGNSRRAIQRAVEHGDAWMPFPNAPETVARRRTPALASPDQLGERAAYMRELCESSGRREPPGIVFSPLAGGVFGSRKFDAPAMIDSIHALAEHGVTGVQFHLAADSRPVYCAYVEGLAKAVLEHLPT